jgi:hypothetical protein
MRAGSLPPALSPFWFWMQVALVVMIAASMVIAVVKLS